MAKGKIKNKIKTAKDKVKTAVKKGVDKAKNTTKYAPLFPFKGIMIALLKAKGVNVRLSDKMDKIAPLFNDVIIKGINHIDYNDYNNITGLVLAEELNHVIEEAAEGIINAILSYITNLKDRKKKGEKLTPDEENFLNGAEKVADKVEDAAIDYGANWLKDLWYVWIILAVLIVYFIAKKK